MGSSSLSEAVCLRLSQGMVVTTGVLTVMLGNIYANGNIYATQDVYATSKSATLPNCAINMLSDSTFVLLRIARSGAHVFRSSTQGQHPASKGRHGQARQATRGELWVCCEAEGCWPLSDFCV